MARAIDANGARRASTITVRRSRVFDAPPIAHVVAVRALAFCIRVFGFGLWEVRAFAGVGATTGTSTPTAWPCSGTGAGASTGACARASTGASSRAGAWTRARASSGACSGTGSGAGAWTRTRVGSGACTGVCAGVGSRVRIGAAISAGGACGASLATGASALGLTFPSDANRRIGLYRASVFAAIGGGVAVGESFTNILSGLATVLFADTVYAGVAGLTRWLFDAHAIDSDFIFPAVVGHTGAAFFVLACGAWVLGFALAVFFYEVGGVALALAFGVSGGVSRARATGFSCTHRTLICSAAWVCWIHCGKRARSHSARCV